MKVEQKEKYQAPQIEVIKLEVEDIIATSNPSGETDPWARRRYASSNDTFATIKNEKEFM